MNVEKFSEAMNELDSRYVEEALGYKRKVWKPVWVKWGVAAAAVDRITPSHDRRIW